MKSNITLHAVMGSHRRQGNVAGRAWMLVMLVLLTLAPLTAQARHEVPRWSRFERTFHGPSNGNPFRDVVLHAHFSLEGSDDITCIDGFYDGDGVYKLRFMPTIEGTWHYCTYSNVPALDGKKGTFTCVAPTGHGPVRVKETHAFAYADGTPYYPIGTTAYAWTHMPCEIRHNTIEAIGGARFNKVRMCVMPKYYSLVDVEPEYYPFPVVGHEGDRLTFDTSRFDPRFFGRLEECIDSLAAIGVEADLIIFHPYDKGHWGFDSLPMEVNKDYVRYLCTRLSSFANVWWSLANEYDYVKAKSEADWMALIQCVREADPYGHLCSIHGSTATYFPYWIDELTHTSIQDEGPVEEAGRASILYNIYRKPVILDEVCYEGNLPYRWGRLCGEEMLHRIWQGLMCGTYVTHGECIVHPGDNDTIFWAMGGHWRGESWKRIGFTRDIIEALPQPLCMADVSRDPRTATAGEGYYLVYMGKEMPGEWLFNLPAKNAHYAKLRPGHRFKVEIIDTWNMTITPWPEVMETGAVDDYRLYDVKHRKIRLPLRPYLLLRITEVVDE